MISERSSCQFERQATGSHSRNCRVNCRGGTIELPARQISVTMSWSRAWSILNLEEVPKSKASPSINVLSGIHLTPSQYKGAWNEAALLDQGLLDPSLNDHLPVIGRGVYRTILNPARLRDAFRREGLNTE
jgi:hypothetical protein